MKIVRLFAVLFAALAAFAAPFHLKDGDRVVFYGDSITDQRLYTTFTETFVLTRFPQIKVTFVHSGWGGDRVTGGGGGPIDLRLPRDVFAYKPTVMTIMLGMNDGGYRAFDQALFDRYTNGYRHIVESAKTNAPGVRITAIQPSPYDDVTRPPVFEGGYNAVLLRYADFLKELAREQSLTLADLNTPVVAALRKANAEDAATAAKILPDRVHPGPGGHLLMAEALLRAWNAPAIVTSVEIDGKAGKVVREDMTSVSEFEPGSAISWTQTDQALPMPFDMRDAALALAVRSSDFVEALDRQPLKVTGLAEGRYALSIDGEKVGAFSAQELAGGINLATLPTPMMRQAAVVHALTLKHNNVHFSRWRTVQVPLADDPAPHRESAMKALDELEADLVEAQRQTAQPKARRYLLRRES